MRRSLCLFALLLVACGPDGSDDAGTPDAAVMDGGGLGPDASLDGGDRGDAQVSPDGGPVTADAGAVCDGLTSMLPPVPTCPSGCACDQLNCMIGGGPNRCECTGCGCQQTCDADDCQQICMAGHCELMVGARPGVTVSCQTDATCVVDVAGSTGANIAGIGPGEVHVDCSNSANCRVACGVGKDCYVDCRNATSCRAICEPGSTCQMLCDGATDCGFEICTGAEDMCAPDVVACRG